VQVYTTPCVIGKPDATKYTQVCVSHLRWEWSGYEKRFYGYRKTRAFYKAGARWWGIEGKSKGRGERERENCEETTRTWRR